MVISNKKVVDIIMSLPPKKRTHASAIADISTTNQHHLVADYISLPPKKRTHELAFSTTNQDNKPHVSKRPRGDQSSTGVDSNNNNNGALLELLRQHIKSNNMDFKDISNAKILLDKKLTKSDMNGKQARLSLPKKQVVPVFLSCGEEAFLQKKVGGDNKNAHIDVKVIMGSSVYNMRLSRWNYDKGSYRYVLKHNWNKLRLDKGFKLGDNIRVVSFRSENRVNFVILGPKRTFTLFGNRVEDYPWY